MNNISYFLKRIQNYATAPGTPFNREFITLLNEVQKEIANNKKRIEELEYLCAEVYQVIGVLASEASRFDDEDVQNVLTNLDETKRKFEILPFVVKNKNGVEI